MALTNSTEYLYGKLNKEIEYLEYKGGKTSTANTIVSSDPVDAEENRVITVNVLKTPYKATFKKDENTLIYFDGSSNVTIDLSEYALDIDVFSSAEMDEDGLLSFYDKKGDLITSVRITATSSTQQQSDLEVTDETSPSFIKNKSTKYLTNEGSDGTSPYATTKEVEESISGFQEGINTNKENIESTQGRVSSIEEAIPEGASASDTLVLNSQLTKTKEDQASENSRLEGLITSETTNRTNADTGLQNSINSINSSITGINTSIEGINGSIEGINGNIETINSDLNKNVLTKAEFSYNASEKKSYIKQTSVNISTGAESTSNSEIPVVSDSQPGLMSTEQLNLLNSSLQSSDITTGTANGSIAVKGTDVPVKGLTDTAFTDKSFFAEDSKVLHNTGDQALNGSLNVTSNVVVGGNLTVSGTTTTNEEVSLTVQDNLIITNAGGAQLANNSGLAIKTGNPSNTGEAYAIVYDPTSTVGGSVKLGLGTISADNEFTFASGSGDPIATRADSADLTDKALMQWDAPNHKLVSSTLTVEDIETSLDSLSVELTSTNNSVSSINGKIPADASTTNQLVTNNTLSNYALDDSVVKLADNQVITGVKEFANDGGLPSTIINPTVAGAEYRGVYTQRLTVSNTLRDTTSKPNVYITTAGVTFNPTSEGAGTLLKATPTTALNELSLPTESGVIALKSDIKVNALTNEEINDISSFVFGSPSISPMSINTVNDVTQEVYGV